ncbi:MAG: hypothetical protein DRP78_03855 [Candidatus Omnitrophota bacterium]|nr:MAG: hypothetical protein DRP78_03855 [Candidatus Omnitrophota bacterium]
METKKIMSFNQIIRKNISIKIFSLFLAVVAWIYINNTVREIKGGPVAYKDIEDVKLLVMGDCAAFGKNMFSVDIDSDTVDLRVKGPQRQIEKLTRWDIVAYVNVFGLKSGKAYSPVVNCILPPDIEIAGALPLARVEIKDKNI